MAESSRTYLPAAGHDWALPLYDPLVKLLGGDAARRALLDEAAIRPNDRVLDVGCGTGNLVVLIKQLQPGADVVGLDPDPGALARARRKAERASVRVQLDRGFSDELPYQAASFDRVVSSLMFHHLGAGEKEKTLHEVRRVLKPGGVFTLMDFAGPESGAHGFLARLFHSGDQLKDNAEAHVLALMRGAGLSDPATVRQSSMFFGQARIAYYRAAAP